MLKLKNALLALMMAAIAVTGFVSCSNDDDDDEPKTVTLPSTIYGNTYKGTQGSMSATLKVTDASKIYLVGGPAAMPTAINVVDQAYTVTKADSVYTVSTTNNGTAFSFTLTVTSADSVTLGYGAMSVVMSKYVDPAEAIAGTYKGTANIKVSTASVDFAGSSFVITKTADSKVSLTVPSMTYSVAMVFPSYTLTDGAVTVSDGTYTITFADTTTDADSNGKTTAISSITATVKDNVLTYSASEKYGSMPFSGALTFTSTSKE